MARGKKGKKKGPGKKDKKKDKKNKKVKKEKEEVEETEEDDPAFSQERPETAFPDMLRFTPYAFAKMMYLRDKGNTEISGFALTDDKDPYLIIDFMMPEQECTGATTEMTAKGIVDLFDKLSGPAKFGGMGISPGRYGRIWIHTHPGFSSEPSGTDWSTFKETFGDKDWAVMFILGKGKEATCILRIEEVPGGHFRIPWDVDWDYAFPGSNFEAWDEEYDDKVEARSYSYRGTWYGGTYQGGTTVSNSQYGKCEVCGKGGVYRYEVKGKQMCWACKQAITPSFIGCGYGPCPECGSSRSYLYRVANKPKGPQACYSCRDNLAELPSDAKDSKYAKWDALMTETEDEASADSTFASDDENGGFVDDDDTPTTEVPVQPEGCEGCGDTRHILEYHEGRWLCWDCESKAKNDAIRARRDAIRDMAVDSGAVDAVDAGNIAEEPNGGFLDDETDASYKCSRCDEVVGFLTLVKGETDEDEDEYLCDQCIADEKEEDQEEVFGAESDDSDNNDTGGFEEEEEETETEPAVTPDETVIDPLDRFHDDPSMPPHPHM